MKQLSSRTSLRNEHTYAVCAYGNSPYLRDCLNSLKSQSIESNVIICTSTPSDFINAISYEYDCKLFVNGIATGIANDWNYAIEKAETPLVTIAHQDDVYSRDYSERMIAMIDDSLDPLIYFTNYGEIRNGYFNDDSKLLRVKRRLLLPYKVELCRRRSFFKKRVLSFGNPICCPSVTYAKEKIPLPLFKENFKSNLDWEAWERLSQIDGEFVYDDYIGVYHRVHEGSETSACIENDIRTNEDKQMFLKFWPSIIANIINGIYRNAQKYN